jgi:excinuclease ABC subunit C
VNERLREKLKTLPTSPGVYLHKSANGGVIYVGKAAVLKNRVRQYFQKTREVDAKTAALVSEIADTDWLETESEIDALFLESELVKRYMPRFNVLLRDDKSQLYVRIDMKSTWPTVTTTRNPSDDGAEYFGPFFNGLAVKKALRYLRRSFPYFIKAPRDGARPELDSHLGLAPLPATSREEYKQNLKQLIRYVKGERKTIVKDLEREMKQAATLHDFEAAAQLRNRIRNLSELQRRIMFGDREFLDISKDHALSDVKNLLGLKYIPKRIEGYDISHMGGTNVVASMVVFTNGVSDRGEYRKFKTKIEHNNDFYNMRETLVRRLSKKNLKNWGRPDLIVIDGGKGQLDAALSAQSGSEARIPMIGLAKKQEQIVLHADSNVTLDKKIVEKLNGYSIQSENFTLITLPHSSHIVKLLQRIRDESHRFAVSYHTVLKRKKMTESGLETIPGIGPATRKKLMRTFGSVKNIHHSSDDELRRVVGEQTMNMIRKYL